MKLKTALIKISILTLWKTHKSLFNTSYVCNLIALEITVWWFYAIQNPLWIDYKFENIISALKFYYTSGIFTPKIVNLLPKMVM